jgi:hypothetical protein
MTTAPSVAVRPHLRHVVLCTADLDRVEAEIIRCFDLPVTQRDDFEQEFGLRNAVFAVGDTFLEVCQPLHSDAPTARFLAAQGGDAGYMACIQVDDLSQVDRRLATARIRVAYAFDGRLINGGVASARHLHPRDTGGTFFTIEQPDPPSSWPYAGPGWHLHRRCRVVEALAAVEVAAADPGAVLVRVATAAGATADPNGIDLGGVRLRASLAPAGTPDRIIGVDLIASDKNRAGEEHVIAGTRIRLV